jgi:phosphoglycolate phosphatase
MNVRFPRAVLIDLDGTLMDTVPDLAEAANRMRLDLGLAPLPAPRIAAFVGKGADVLVHRALTDDLAGRVDAQRFATARAAFFSHYHAVNGLQAIVFDAVPAALERLRRRGLRLACVTNKPREFTLPLLGRLSLAALFDVVVAGDDVQEKKPHPALLLEACTRLGVAPADALMLGDSVNDALAAAAAGCPCVLVETGYNEGEPVAALAAAPGVLGVFADLPRAVDALLAAPDDASPAVSRDTVQPTP